MTPPTTALTIAGRTHTFANGQLLVLDRRLTGYDTFLAGMVEIGHATLKVRIITLDDVTVLQPVAADLADPLPETWTGLLYLPHGQRPRQVPDDLRRASTDGGRSLASLDEADLHYALTFLAEATTPAIRQARIEVIVAALPPLTPDIRDVAETAR